MGTNFSSLILFILLFLSQANSQGYYPLEIGNVWQYYDIWEPEYGFTITAITDTIMLNGLTYTFLQADEDQLILFYRQTGPKVYNYSTFEQHELLLYDFSKTTGDTVAINYYSGDTTVVTVVYDQMANVFGEMRRQLGFWEQSLISSAYTLREVTDSIGVTYFGGEVAIGWHLQGALINGTQYGTLDLDAFFTSNPVAYRVLLNYPNPFNSSTIIRFKIPEEGYISVTIFDIMGRQVRKLFNGKAHIGLHQIVWDGRDDFKIELGSGSYIYTVKTENFVSSNKMILLR